MNIVTSKAVAKIAAVATGLAMATSMLAAPMAHAASLTSAQVQSIISLLQSFGADASTIANVQASLTGGTPTSTGSTGGSTVSCTFTTDLTVGSKGADVTNLQTILSQKGYLSVAPTGYFGSLTQAAVAKWQAAAGVTPAAGYFGAKSRAALCGSMSSGGTTGSTGGTTVSGNGLKIMLAPTSPSNSVLVQGQAIGDLGEYSFSNPSSAPIMVTALTFNRIGVSNDQTIDNVYLYNGVSRITDSAGVSNGQFTFTNPNGIFTVQPGMSYTVAVRADIDKTNTNGQQIGVSLVSAQSSGTLDSSVSFPIASGYQTISAANLATVDFNATTLPSAATTISPQSAYPVWQNTVNVSTNAVKLSSMMFTNLGSIDGSYLQNVRLYVDGTQVGPTIPSMSGTRTASFDLSASPVMLTQAGHVIKVLADITGGANRTVQFSIQRSSDAMLIDSQLNQPVTPTKSGGSFGAVTSGGAITINSVNGTSGVSVTRDPASNNQPVAVGATNVNFATFDMLASGENTKVNDLFVYSTLASGTHTGSSLANGKIFVNGVQVGSTKSIGPSTSETDFSLGSSLILPAGQTTKVAVYADAKTSTGANLSNGETVTITLDTATANAQGQSSLNSANVPAAAVSGNAVVVSSSSLTATKYSGYGNQTMIAGTTNGRIGAFTLSAGSTEGVTVNTVVIDLTSAAAASITNLTLKDDATGNVLGTVVTTPSTSNSFSINTDVPMSSTKTFDIYANILTGAGVGPIQASLDATTGGVGDQTGTSATIGSTLALQTMTVGSGSLSVTRGAGDPVSANVIAGASQIHVGQFNFAAQNSAYTVQNLAVLVPNSAATSVSSVMLSYKDANGTTQTQTQSLAVNPSLPYATATFQGLTYYVPMNDSSNIDVYVGTPTVASGATSGAAVNVSLDLGAGTNTFRAIDSSGAAKTIVGSGAAVASNGTFYVRKSIPTVGIVAGQGGNISPSNPVYRFTISADQSNPIEWTKLVFNVATSGTATSLSNVYLVDESTGQNILDNNTTSASTTQTQITVDLTKNAVQPEYQQIAAGSSKTYDLDGTIAGFTTGSSLTISLAQDNSKTANAAAGSVSGNFVWSDRSASSHTAPSVGVAGTADFTNGYLVQNFTTTSVTYSK